VVLFDGTKPPWTTQINQMILMKSSESRANQNKYELKSFNPVLYENGAYQINPELEVQLDAKHLEQLELSSLTDTTLLSSVVQIYLGDFMPGVKTDWVLEKRKECQEKG
jgi:two-component SAPR family response regulator